MKTKRLLIASLAVNALLLGAGAYLVTQDLGDLSEPPPLIVCVGHAWPEGTGPSLASTGPSTNLFRRESWQRIESENYVQYVGRLRGLGCPEKTVCDIVTADVNEMFRRRAQPDVYTASRFAP